jgi:hypothetical protein
MPLFRSMPPMPDEWLSGLIARASATNGFERSSDILSFAGLGVKRPEYLAFSSEKDASNLARLLGVPLSTLMRYFHSRLDPQTVDFFGVAVRDLFIERSIRRVSPAALRISPYSRAIWQIRTFGFDPQTLDPLISCCPECHTELGFRVTQGIEFCDQCRAETHMGFTMPTVDLREIKQKPHDVEDRVALDFVTGLLNPMFPDLSVSEVPDEVGTRDRGKLFEIAHVIAAAIKMNADGTIDRNNWHRSEIGPIEPEFLAKAGRAILDFPVGFVRVCEEAGAEASKRPGEWGVLKTFGALARIPRDRYVEPQFRFQVAELLKDTLASKFESFGIVGKGQLRPDKFVPLRTIKDTMLDSQSVLMRLAEHPKTLRVKSGASAKAPVLLHRSQAQLTLVQYKDQVEAMTVALTLGVPATAVFEMVDSGLDRRNIFFYAGTSIDIATPVRHMSSRGLGILIDRLICGKKPVKPGPTFCTFSEAMLMFPAGRRPWVPLIRGMLAGEVDYVLHKRPGKGVLKAVSVSGVQFIRDQLMDEQAALPRSRLTSLTAGSVNLMLGISFYPAFQALVTAGQLVPKADGTYGYDHVLAFANEYIFANEMGMRGQRPTSIVRSWMDAHGVTPAFDFDTKGGLIYRRAEVEPLLELTAQRVEFA